MRAVLVMLLSLAAAPLAAAGATPSEASVRHLLEVMKARTLSDESMKTMDQLMQHSVAELREEQHQRLNARQQQILDDFHEDMMQAIREQMSWDKLQPTIVAIYARTFTPKEIADMTRFYGSPTGQAVVGKLPAVQREMALSVQASVQPLIQKIVAAQRDLAGALHRAADPVAVSPAPAAPATPAEPAAPR